MRNSWIKKIYRTAKRTLQNNYLLQLLIVSLIAEKEQPRRLQKNQKPEKIFKIKKSDLLLIFGVIVILMMAVYITYRTGALESTRYYQIK